LFKDRHVKAAAATPFDARRNGVSGRYYGPNATGIFVAAVSGLTRYPPRRSSTASFAAIRPPPDQSWRCAA